MQKTRSTGNSTRHSMPWVRIPCRWCRLCRHWRRIVLAYTAQALHRYSFSTVRIHPLRLTKNTCHKITLLRVIPTVTNYFVIVSDNSSGSIYVFWHAHWDLAVAVPTEIWSSQLRPGSALRSGARGWGPAVPTEIWPRGWGPAGGRKDGGKEGRKEGGN